MPAVPEMPDQRAFITGILRDMEGNSVLSLASGRTAPTDTAPNGNPIIDRHYWFAYPREIDLMVAFAERAWNDRADAYISPLIYGNEPFRDKRTGEIVTRTRDGRPIFARSLTNAQFSQTVYMDSDSCPPEAFRLPPSRHLQSSEINGQDYWFLSEPVPASVASTLAHKITTAHESEGTDKSGWSKNKVLRLPTWNLKYDEFSPWSVVYADNDTDERTGEQYDEARVYYHGDLEEVYGDVVIDAAPRTVGEPVTYEPVPPLEGLPDHTKLLDRIPSTNKGLSNLIFSTPKDGPDGWRSEQRFRLLLELKRFGFTDEETIAVAWHSPAASKWRVDRRGADGLWWELQVKVKAELFKESPESVEAAPVTQTGQALGLISHEARARVEARDDFFSSIVSYALSKVKVQNMPYHIINTWTYLSVALSEYIEFPKEPRSLGTGIYSITLGGSSTGKDEAYSIYSPMISAVLTGDSEAELAAMSSKDSYIERLLDRDNKVSYIHENEFDGLLEQVKIGGSGTQGLIQVWTRTYDGEVPPLGRVKNKDLGRSGVHAIPVMHMMGTPEGVIDQLETKNFYTGWLARNIWVFGENVDTTKESLGTNVRRGGQKTRQFDYMPRYFASHIHHTVARLFAQIPFESTRIPIEPTDEAIELIDAAKWTLHESVSAEYDIGLWRPILRRMYDIMWKIATLQAASNGRVIVGVRDAEVALYYVEMWMANAMQAAQQVSDSYFARQCDEIEKMIAASPRGEVEIGAVYRFRKNEPKRIVDEYLLSLGFQGRVEEKKDGEKRLYKLKTHKEKK